MPGIYGFTEWVEQHLGPDATPADVQRYFAARNVHVSVEKWRLFMQRAPLRPDLKLWGGICDATGEPLSRFIDHQPHPDGVKEAIRFAGKKKCVENGETLLTPPRPWKQAGGRTDG